MPLAFGNAALDAIAAEHPAGTLRAQARAQASSASTTPPPARSVAMPPRSRPRSSRRIAFHHGGPDGVSIPSPETAA